MIRMFCNASAIALLSACSTTATEPPLEETDFIAAVIDSSMPEGPVTIVETSTALPLPGQLKRVTQDEEVDVSPAEAIRLGASEARIEPSVDGYVNAIQIYPYTEGALYRLYAAPGQVSDIALQPGETLVSVSAGDTVRWVVGDTESGSGASSRAHVLVKPITGGISTNLMIATDRRTYHLELESTDNAYMAALSWRYPQDELGELTARNHRAVQREAETVTGRLSLSDLSFDYRLSGDDPDWRPVRVFDDGRRVFIQMPEDLETTDAPPLFVLGSSDEAELVNYRVRGRYYVVDRLFAAAELRLGEAPQTVVRITKGARRSGLAALFGG
jgi:type IV secretion system protein VirB9